MAPTVPGGAGGPLLFGALLSTLIPLAYVALGIVIAVSVVRTRRATERIEKRLEALERASRDAATPSPAGPAETGARPDGEPLDPARLMPRRPQAPGGDG
ncbi:hypothetical protein ITJ44_07380 [Clavibacter sp. VKM Ac-2873]|uniref:hypothetical protein n=1 Tax=Clavibacter sp. VKM Ac-2873 TaxID=2783813 RepID=UPI00188A1348|nr:hypothetical protein [Clavibacter sp. VKM Ac-2873]MBF4617894.1 hypothetical protein [Clavibacter sp. VKM Ac-2873]